MSKKNKFNTMFHSEYEKLADFDQIQVSDGSFLRILKTKAKRINEITNVLFLVPGWGTIPLGWDDFLIDIMTDFDIFYLETREKDSSLLNKETKHDLDRCSSDIKDVVEFLNINQRRLVIMGSSFSTPIIAHALATGKIKPKLGVLVGPAIKFKPPPMFMFLTALIPGRFITILKPIGKLWVKFFKSEDEVQAAKYYRVLKEADPVKWKRVGRNFPKLHFSELYKKIPVKMLIVDETTDKMHETEQTQKVASFIEDCIYIDLETNRNTHSSPMATAIRNCLRN
ncbi:MAG: hypothetical protein ACFFDS_06540 [Candidatus Thorarchaeota archaeon]